MNCRAQLDARCLQTASISGPCRGCGKTTAPPVLTGSVQPKTHIIALTWYCAACCPTCNHLNSPNSSNRAEHESAKSATVPEFCELAGADGANGAKTGVTPLETS